VDFLLTCILTIHVDNSFTLNNYLCSVVFFFRVAGVHQLLFGRGRGW
jgi:TM2 domain-containing membrane protein YozV